MDRQIVYPGQILPETTLLNMARDPMIGLGKLAAAVLGTTTLVNGLACTPTAPASMQVQVAAGEIYSLQNLDGTAYSSLAADTTHSLLKQGLLMDPVNLTCPAPATSGQSVNYLVQVIYQDVDVLPVMLPYYNASNPTQAYSGPAGSGTAQNTVRKGVCTVSVKAGIAATTGTQTTPSADSGYVGLWVVTVANGQSTITSSNIAVVSGAPFLSETLTQKISQAFSDSRYVQISRGEGDWSATITYGLNSKIIGDDGIPYRSIKANNINHAPSTSPTWWIPAQPVTAIVTRNADLSLTAAAPLKHTWNSVKRDVYGMFDSVNNQFVAKWTGIYEVNGAVHLTPSASTVSYIHALVNNDGTSNQASRTGSGGSFSGLTSFTIAAKIFLNAGDTVALYSYLGANATQNTFSDDDHNHFSFTFIGEK